MARLFELDDSDAYYLHDPNNWTVTYPFTFGGWAKKAALSTIQLIATEIVSGANIWVLYLHSGGTARFGARTTSPNFTSADTVNVYATDSTWIHVVGVAVSATNRRIILNGDLVNMGVDTDSKTPSGHNRISYATNPSSGPTFYDGTLGEMSAWNFAMSDAQVVEWYNSKKSAIDFHRAGLVSYQPFGPTIWDWVHGKTPVTQGSPLYVDDPPFTRYPVVPWTGVATIPAGVQSGISGVGAFPQDA